MATKQQAIKALAAHCPAAMLIEIELDSDYSVMLEAPEGHHWSGSVHCKAVATWFKGGYPKSEYWAEVITDIRELTTAVPCDSDDCEGVREWGECEYWEES